MNNFSHDNVIPEDIEKNFGATGCLWQKVGEKDKKIAAMSHISCY